MVSAASPAGSDGSDGGARTNYRRIRRHEQAARRADLARWRREEDEFIAQSARILAELGIAQDPNDRQQFLMVLRGGKR